MRETHSISRRRALALGVAGAAGMALGLCGCGAGEEDTGFVEFDLKEGVLPLGSVVILDDGTEPEVSRLIIARQPVCLQEDHVYEYAGVVWPLGIISDISGSPFSNEVHLFDSEAIKGVRFVGMQDDAEAEAAARLADSSSRGGNSLDALLPLALEMGVVELDDGEDS